MECFYIIFLTSLGSCLCEWVLLPSINPKQVLTSSFSQNKRKNLESDNEVSGKISGYSSKLCPDFHNLTTMSYGTVFKDNIQSRTGWEISFEDVEELLKQNEKLPKTTKEKADLIKQMGDDLMLEADHQIKTLFSPSREARTKDFHFPSMESALLTISMLLFGVYLSKLILKLLLSHYNRYNGGVAMMTGIRAPLTITQGRRKRAALLQKIHLMYLIEKYNSQFNYTD